MSAVVMERYGRNGWETLGTVTKEIPPASITSYENGIRNVYIFGWQDGEGPYVWRSRLGVDEEVGQVRVVHPLLGLERVHDLSVAPYPFDRWNLSNRKVALRFRYVP